MGLKSKKSAESLLQSVATFNVQNLQERLRRKTACHTVVLYNDSSPRVVLFSLELAVADAPLDQYDCHGTPQI